MGDGSVHRRAGRRGVRRRCAGPRAARHSRDRARHHDQSVIVVSHKATLRLIISSLLGFDPRGFRDRLDQSPACLNVLEFKDAVRARLMLFNDVAHYQDWPRRPEANLSRWWDSQRYRRGKYRRSVRR